MPSASAYVGVLHRYGPPPTIGLAHDTHTNASAHRFFNIAIYVKLGMHHGHVWREKAHMHNWRTGTRASAIASASPYRDMGHSFVDLDQGIYYRLAIGKRATNKRQTPAPIPPRLLAHMRRWVRRGIVTSHFVEWQGAPVKSVKTGFRHAVGLAGLWGKVTPHTLRHTAATWLMQRGVPIWQAAGYLGMSSQMIERTYGHHHPDYMRGCGAGDHGETTTERFIGCFIG